ncbi:50S ribosomal protein L25/general stress protein Ctc [Streptomyces bohaiensis]|uniref:Large ribosomal subunit protein bL25 n=1 Tax=Streptomyces bohaiensis TaxID=1431344 RepID=A0ABX1CE18_9ACTN|nr:50S ribosomal protein L25/general stress protein Ctc [Streptomyces bohaiensis]NJQ17341.1 50S ribosomal protein L25/general stress protein Ctc [Streptomyces bohaiensis]
MADVTIPAQPRTEFGKGAARRNRVADRIPGVVYGHGADPVHVTLPAYDLMMALKTPNVLIDLAIEGSKNQLVIPKAIQREALRNKLVHIDLLVVKKGEKVTVEVPVEVSGDLAPGQHLLEHNLTTLSVEAEATHLPESVAVSVEGLATGDQVLAKDIKLAKGITLVTEEEAVVVQVVAPQAEEPAADAEGTEDGAENGAA